MIYIQHLARPYPSILIFILLLSVHQGGYLNRSQSYEVHRALLGARYARAVLLGSTRSNAGLPKSHGNGFAVGRSAASVISSKPSTITSGCTTRIPNLFTGSPAPVESSARFTNIKKLQIRETSDSFGVLSDTSKAFNSVSSNVSFSIRRFTIRSRAGRRS
jgi:hypothetical protein